MKSLLLISLLVSLVLFGCGQTLSSLERKYGPPDKIERSGDEISYYYFFQIRGKVPPQIFGRYPSPQLSAYAAGSRLCVFTADKNGKIISETRFWRQQMGGR
jgi:hypothetical protein